MDESDYTDATLDSGLVPSPVEYSVLRGAHRECEAPVLALGRYGAASRSDSTWWSN